MSDLKKSSPLASLWNKVSGFCTKALMLDVEFDKSRRAFMEKAVAATGTGMMALGGGSVSAKILSDLLTPREAFAGQTGALPSFGEDFKDARGLFVGHSFETFGGTYETQQPTYFSVDYKTHRAVVIVRDGNPKQGKPIRYEFFTKTRDGVPMQAKFDAVGSNLVLTQNDPGNKVADGYALKPESPETLFAKTELEAILAASKTPLPAPPAGAARVEWIGPTRGTAHIRGNISAFRMDYAEQAGKVFSTLVIAPPIPGMKPHRFPIALDPGKKIALETLGANFAFDLIKGATVSPTGLSDSERRRFEMEKGSKPLNDVAQPDRNVYAQMPAQDRLRLGMAIADTFQKLLDLGLESLHAASPQNQALASFKGAIRPAKVEGLAEVYADFAKKYGNGAQPLAQPQPGAPGQPAPGLRERNLLSTGLGG